jgi:aspartokinase
VRKETNALPRKPAAISVAHSLDEAVYEVDEVKPAELFETLADASVDVDAIVQIGSGIVFSAPLADRLTTASALEGLGAVWSEHGRLARIRVEAAGTKGRTGITAKVFATMREARLEPQFISASPAGISFYVPHDDVDRAVEALREAFDPARRTAGA